MKKRRLLPLAMFRDCWIQLVWGSSAVEEKPYFVAVPLKQRSRDIAPKKGVDLHVKPANEIDLQDIGHQWIPKMLPEPFKFGGSEMYYSDSFRRSSSIPRAVVGFGSEHATKKATEPSATVQDVWCSLTALRTSISSLHALLRLTCTIAFLIFVLAGVCALTHLKPDLQKTIGESMRQIAFGKPSDVGIPTTTRTSTGTTLLDAER